VVAANETIPPALELRSGDLVEVRSVSEILAMLDGEGCLDSLPFMREMLVHCGKRFRVYKRADKTCDTIEKTGCRRMRDTVHLEGLRCDGAAHGGCQASCLLFWKESWLRRVEPRAQGGGHSESAPRPSCTEDALDRFACHSEGGEERFRCQATELRRASRPLAWWDPRQYWRDLHAGNFGVRELLHAFFYRLITNVIRFRGHRLLIGFYNRVQHLFGGAPYPLIVGTLKRTPSERLDLRPGERVRVKSLEQVRATLDGRRRNRGLLFDQELTPYCGGTFTVRARVERIIDERKGRMIELPNDCIILEDVVCRAWFSERKIGCPRAIYPYWREIWLERASRSGE
jgi:hypothetical protein